MAPPDPDRSVGSPTATPQRLAPPSAPVPWRLFADWLPAVIQHQRGRLAGRSVGDPSLAALTTPDLRPTPGWTVERVEALLGYELAGPPQPDGCFARSRATICTYRFADPRITRGYFDADAPLLGRDILVAIRVLGLRLLGAVRVGAVIDETWCSASAPVAPTPDPVTLTPASGRGADRGQPQGAAAGDCARRGCHGRTRFGLRMDSLGGHVLTGAEWLSIIKDHRTGAVRLRIDVQWRPGQLPTWWMRLGLRLLGRQFQRRWRRQAVRRLRALGDAPSSWPGRRCLSGV